MGGRWSRFVSEFQKAIVLNRETGMTLEQMGFATSTHDASWIFKGGSSDSLCLGHCAAPSSAKQWPAPRSAHWPIDSKTLAKRFPWTDGMRPVRLDKPGPLFLRKPKQIATKR